MVDKRSAGNDFSVGTVLALITVFIIGLLMYFINQITEKKEPLKHVEQVAQTTQSTSSAPKQSGPKTYSNNKYGFEFVYPSEQNLSEFETGVLIDTTSGNRIAFYVSPDNSATIAEYLTLVDKISSKAYEGRPAIQVKSVSKTVINDNNCIKREEYLNAADITQTNTYFKHGNIVVSVVFLPTPGNTRDVDAKIYDQILSTFKFTK